MTQAEPSGRRSKWIATLLEYDIEIRPTKLVKGQGLAKLMAQLNHEALGINFFEPCTDIIAQQEEEPVHLDFLASPWYKDIIYTLQHLQAPLEIRKTKEISVRLKDAKFCIINSYLYWKDPSSILLNCLLKKSPKRK